MVLQNQDKNSQTNSLNTDNKIIETTKSVKLLSITIESQLKFNEHISNLCNKASMQLNGINCLQRHMGSQEMKAIINSSMQISTTVLLFHISVHANPIVKLSNFKIVA